MNISMSPKIMQMHITLYVSSLETSGKHLFLFWMLLRGKYINHKKLNVKTWFRPYTRHTKGHTPKCFIWTCRPNKRTVSKSVFSVSSYTYTVLRLRLNSRFIPVVYIKLLLHVDVYFIVSHHHRLPYCQWFIFNFMLCGLFARFETL